MGEFAAELICKLSRTTQFFARSRPVFFAALADLLSARSSFVARLLQKTADRLRGGTHATAKGQRTGGKSKLAGQLLWGCERLSSLS
jgi:hypothetical protein